MDELITLNTLTMDAAAAESAQVIPEVPQTLVDHSTSKVYHHVKHIIKYQRKMQAPQAPRHENIVRMIATFEDQNLYLAVLKAADKVMFLEFQHSVGTIEYFAREVASGLVHLYSQNIVHRDIRPESVLITTSLEIKVFEFTKFRQLQDGVSAEAARDMLNLLLFGSPDMRMNMDEILRDSFLQPHPDDLEDPQSEENRHF
ncbi:3-phosphoinositide dependent protein kinase-1 [Mortierella sp. NVP41]|nr:3-phosphoinositide dependent protein kinase-1 [Mortierella sp. NVP41]